MANNSVNGQFSLASAIIGRFDSACALCRRLKLILMDAAYLLFQCPFSCILTYTTIYLYSTLRCRKVLAIP